MRFFDDALETASDAIDSAQRRFNHARTVSQSTKDIAVDFLATILCVTYVIPSLIYLAHSSVVYIMTYMIEDDESHIDKDDHRVEGFTTVLFLLLVAYQFPLLSALHKGSKILPECFLSLVLLVEEPPVQALCTKPAAKPVRKSFSSDSDGPEEGKGASPCEEEPSTSLPVGPR